MRSCQLMNQQPTYILKSSQLDARKVYSQLPGRCVANIV